VKYDVFLSHNGRDKSAVRSLGLALQQRGLAVWLDEWELQPGLPWQPELEKIICDCKAAMVCVGGSGIGPWEQPEMRALLRRFVNEKRIGNIVPVIPVLLPGAPNKVDLPPFLEDFTFVDLRQGLTVEGLERLRWGITGEKPRENAPTVCFAKVTPDLRKERETVANYLTSSRVNILPSKAYPADPERSLKALELDLQHADVFVQILGRAYADRTEELPEGEEFAQFQLAQKRGKVILQWRAKSVELDDIDDPAHKALVGGADVICNDLAEFAKLVDEQAKLVHAKRIPAKDGGQTWYALIEADKPDDDVADEVVKALVADNVNCRIPHNGTALVDFLRKGVYQAVLIVCGACSPEWLELRGEELMAVDMDLKDQAPVRAYYVCTDKTRLPYLGKNVLQVKRRDQESWQRLMSAIQQRGGKP
jgi:hypothetical protein